MHAANVTTLTLTNISDHESSSQWPKNHFDGGGKHTTADYVAKHVPAKYLQDVSTEEYARIANVAREECLKQFIILFNRWMAQAAKACDLKCDVVGGAGTVMETAFNPKRIGTAWKETRELRKTLSQVLWIFERSHKQPMISIMDMTLCNHAQEKIMNAVGIEYDDDASAGKKGGKRCDGCISRTFHSYINSRKRTALDRSANIKSHWTRVYNTNPLACSKKSNKTNYILLRERQTFGEQGMELTLEPYKKVPSKGQDKERMFYIAVKQMDAEDTYYLGVVRPSDTVSGKKLCELLRWKG